MKSKIIKDKKYKDLLSEIKTKVRSSQIKAAVSVNSELMDLYWNIGRAITEKQLKAKWGDGIIDQLSNDLMIEFPEMQGFSSSNLKYIRRWFLFYSPPTVFGQQLVDQITRSLKSQQLVDQSKKTKNQNESISQLIRLIPWGHNIQIIVKCKDVQEAVFYITETIKNNWSRSLLSINVDCDL